MGAAEEGASFSWLGFSVLLRMTSSCALQCTLTLLHGPLSAPETRTRFNGAITEPLAHVYDTFRLPS